LSLVPARAAADEFVAKIGDLDRLLDKEATAGRGPSAGAHRGGAWGMLGVTVAGLALGGAFASFGTRAVSRPGCEAGKLAQAMAKGDLRQRIPLKQKDEVGQLADATNTLAESLTRIVTEIQKVSESLAGSAADLSGVSNQLLSQSEHASLRATSVA